MRISRQRLVVGILVLGVLSSPLRAESELGPPLDAEAFEARVAGQTIRFSAFGQAYGAEQYLPDRQVLWAFEDAPCRRGRWSEPRAGEICFTYEHDPRPQCWNFYDRGGRLWANFLGEGESAPLEELSRSTVPLNCPAPDLGA